MPIEVPQPKYVVVVNAIQQRITDGTYPPGSAIPSEAQITAEFGVSRPTAVRALGILQQDGWIESEQGKGRFVRSRGAIASRHAPSQAMAILSQEDSTSTKILKIGPVLASSRIAGALGIETGTPVIARQRLSLADIGPVELATSYVPVELAAGTGVGDDAPISEGLIRRLSRRKGVEFDHAIERIGARLPSKEEAKLLEVENKECLLTLLFTAYDRAGKALLAVDVVIPASRHEFEDSFPLD